MLVSEHMCVRCSVCAGVSVPMLSVVRHNLQLRYEHILAGINQWRRSDVHRRSGVPDEYMVPCVGRVVFILLSQYDLNGRNMPVAMHGTIDMRRLHVQCAGRTKHV